MQRRTDKNNTYNPNFRQSYFPAHGSISEAVWSEGHHYFRVLELRISAEMKLSDTLIEGLLIYVYQVL